MLIVIMLGIAKPLQGTGYGHSGKITVFDENALVVIASGQLVEDSS
ncbi:MAG TPA: hypothetical protein V6C95_14545 [Coleofasciculaceae cyanobacterium]